MSENSDSLPSRRSLIPWQAKLAIALICSALVAGGIFYGLIRNYLHGDGFRRLLSEKASNALDTKGEFSAFRWDGLALESANFSATGDGAVRSLEIDGLRSEIHLGGLKQGVWQVTGSKINRLNATLDFNNQKLAQESTTSLADAAPAIPQTKREKSTSSNWLPRDVSFDGLDIADATISARFGENSLVAERIQVNLQASGKQGHALQLRSGTIRMPSQKFPPLDLESARLKHQDERVFLSQLSLRSGDTTRIEATGEFDNSAGRHSLEGTINGVKCSDVLGEDWIKRLSGELETSFSANNHNGASVARGKLVLKNGILTAFPALEAIANYTNTKRYHSLALNEAHGDWQWQDGRLSFENFTIASEGAIRAEGQITIDGDKLDGTMNLGLPPEVVEKIPGASTDIFTTEERGLRWALVRISGTTKKPKEDLSSRMITAASLHILAGLTEKAPATGEQAAEAILNDPKPIEKGAEIILKNSETAREILKGLLRKAPASE